MGRYVECSIREQCLAESSPSQFCAVLPTESAEESFDCYAPAQVKGRWGRERERGRGGDR